MRMIAFGCSVLLVLPIVHAIAPNLFYFLPLGGNAISEIGIVLGLCVAIATIREALRGNIDGKN